MQLSPDYLEVLMISNTWTGDDANDIITSGANHYPEDDRTRFRSRSLLTFQDLCGSREISRHSYKTNKSIDQLLKETEKEAPKTAPKPAQKSADSSDDDFVSDDDEGMIYTIITAFKITTSF